MRYKEDVVAGFYVADDKLPLVVASAKCIKY